MNNTIPRLVVSAGEPAGIGPDILLKAINQPYLAEIITIGDPALFHARLKKLNLPIKVQETDLAEEPRCAEKNVLKVLPLALNAVVTPGILNAQNADYVLAVLDRCIAACQEHKADAMVTGPIQKSILNSVYPNFSGHTEYLAEKTGSELPVMMLATEGLRVALVTTHAPLRKVPGMITQQRLEKIITILHHDLQHQFKIDQPRIIIAGLNPHAGEDGHLGTEEIEIIEPVIRRLQEKGMNLLGPLPADTLFTDEYLHNADAVLAMYHDQGLPVLKYKGFGNAINITLGLPIIRTSVDHGTALALAGTGTASASSMRLALQSALQICQAGR